MIVVPAWVFAASRTNVSVPLFVKVVAAEPLVLSSEPPAMTSGPLPIAVAELRLRRPVFRIVVPV